jgi:hypothetical protein
MVTIELSTLISGGIWVQCMNSPAFPVGKSEDIRNAHKTLLPNVIASVTLAFSEDGEKVFFIDHKVFTVAFHWFQGNLQVFSRGV